MQFFYDGQIRRYTTQLMRLLSNFPVKDGKGNLKNVPVMYGDLTRQVAHLIRDNSENKLPSAPRISLYITGIEQDRSRTADSTYIHKMNIRERAYDEEGKEYLNTQGQNYTIERLMPTPYILKANADIWATNTEQKLQLMEQILVWFNPSLEIQTTENFIDWTSITTVNLEGITWTNRSVPVGVDSQIDIATVNFSLPIYITPPAKVKKLGVITNIITSIFNEDTGDIERGITRPELNAYDDYLSAGSLDTDYGRIATTDLDPEMANVNYSQYSIYVDGSDVKIISRGKIGAVNWRELLELLPGPYTADVSRIYVKNYSNDTEFTGTISLNPLDERILSVNWDTDSFPSDTVITGPTGDKTTIDYIIDPTRFNPSDVKSAGTRILLLDSIGDASNEDGPDAWKNADNTDFIASANDIVEWDGSKWTIVFDASTATEVTYVTNLNTGTQYKYTDDSWLLSVDGEYQIGTWRIDLYG